MNFCDAIRVVAITHAFKEAHLNGPTIQIAADELYF